ncbi:MAG: hypothetical protein ACR2JC_21095 [Chloroflexota bacterium]
MQRLIDDDAVGQLRRREGRMRELGSENGEPKLDWVQGVARLLHDSDAVETVEVEARELWQRGIRHVIWSGMGGSVMAVRVLIDFGFFDGADTVTVHPLDSTDPAALNAIVRDLAWEKDTVPDDRPSALRALLSDVLMAGVSMGMTSEEPITHLAWFLDLLERAGLQPAGHLLVMTLPGSHLDSFAHEHDLPTRSLQLDGGNGTPGRFSAPSTRVFLLPAALALCGAQGNLLHVLRRAWDMYDLQSAEERPETHTYVRFAAHASDASVDDVCLLFLGFHHDTAPLVPWIEQLVEESLGKRSQGILVLPAYGLEQSASPIIGAPYNAFHNRRALAGDWAGSCALTLAPPVGKDTVERLARVASTFMGWQLVTALFGYLHGITFAGQPAVENYKARAHALRGAIDPLEVALRDEHVVTGEDLTLVGPRGSSPSTHGGTPGGAFAEALRLQSYRYLDLTVNGEPSEAQMGILNESLEALGAHLHLPVRLRRAPAAYHSTEQSEMDGPAPLLSVRLIARRHEASLLGSYDDSFLRAQAVATWQAMNEAGRSCFLLIANGDNERMVEAASRFFGDVLDHLQST